jgi:heat shock protein HslJ
MMLRKITWLMILALLLAACANDGGLEPAADETAIATPPFELAGSEWTLESLNGAALAPESNITLTFEADSLGGYSGCNSYGGPYTATAAGGFDAGEIAMTAMACLEQPIMDQEAAFSQALLEATTYSVTDDELRLSNANGETTLVFRRRIPEPMDPVQLQNTDWQLVTVNGESLLPGRAITLRFGADQATGYAGCRSYEADFSAEGDHLSFPMISMVETVCWKPESYLLQEGQFTEDLGRISHYRLADGLLEIVTVQDRTLSFAPATGEEPIGEEGAWVLAAFEDGAGATPALTGAEVTAQFEAGGIQGKAGCNSYSAEISGSGPITVSAPISTRMACNEPAGVMEQESRYLEQLSQVTSYRIQGDELRLETADGAALVFHWQAPAG